ncbi:MAG: DUF3422 domain-containing protein [Roseimicrobium sp.]
MQQDHLHAQYAELHAELLARPFPVVSGQVMVSHCSVAFSVAEAEDHRRAVDALASHLQLVTTYAGRRYQIHRLAGVDFRIERHTEFTSFMVIAPQSGKPFAESAFDLLAPTWLDSIPGKVIAAVEIASEVIASQNAGTAETMDRISRCFDQERIIGAWVVERDASVWSHFKLDNRNATRFLIHTHGCGAGRYGRLLQRLIEIEIYRMMAMLSLPLAQELLPEIETLESQHVSLVERIGLMDAGDERALLGDLTNLSLATERLQARCGSRFSLTESYARILTARLRELKEEQVPGYQTISEFFDRRLVQALHTCETAYAGLNALSERLQSTTGLLRTRVEVNLQSTNQLLLASVDRRAEAQLRLQHNVEGLSVVVLTYYLASLVKLALEGIDAAGIHFDSHLAIALLLPLIAGAVWRTVRHFKQAGH